MASKNSPEKTSTLIFRTFSTFDYVQFPPTNQKRQRHLLSTIFLLISFLFLDEVRILQITKVKDFQFVYITAHDNHAWKHWRKINFRFYTSIEKTIWFFRSLFFRSYFLFSRVHNNIQNVKDFSFDYIIQISSTQKTSRKREREKTSFYVLQI